MRPDLTAATRALLDSGWYDDHWKIQVANADGTLVDLSARAHAVSGSLPNPETPIGTLRVEFLRELEGPEDSLAPLIASDLNVKNDGVTYAPLLQVGRVVVASVALTAVGGARPASGYYEVFRGRIRSVEWPGQYGRATIHCNDQGGALQLTKSEKEYTYAAGTSIEGAAQQVLNNNGWSSVVLNVPTATSNVLEADYGPGKQKTVWEQVWGLAQSTGRVVWWRYQADGAADLTLFAPERTKSTSDFTFPRIEDVTQLDVDEAEIGNVLYGEFSTTSGARESAGPVENPDSIAKYGGIRRSFWVSEEEDSPIRSSADMLALLNAIAPDLADPDAIATYKVPLFVFGECSVDLYTFPADNIHYDSPQQFAPFAISFEARAQQRSHSSLQVRGKPSGGSGEWRSRRVRVPVTEPEKVLALNNFRDEQTSATQVSFVWEAGAKVAAVWVFSVLRDHPYTGSDPYPDVSGEPTATLRGVSRYTVDVPPQGKALYFYFVPYDKDGRPGKVERGKVIPTITQPDAIRSLTVSINDADGSATVRAEVVDRCLSVRFSRAVGADPSWPADASVESGAVVAVVGGVASVSYAAGTVALNQRLRVRAAGYVNADGTGADGTGADHGEIQGAEDIRLPVEPILDTPTHAESGSTGTFGATVRDPNGIATGLYYRTKQGTGTPSAWVLVTGTPGNGTAYTANIAMQEGHQGFVEFRLDYTYNGQAKSFPLSSAGFDLGAIPNITIKARLDEDNATGSCSVTSDVDTASVKAVARTDRLPTAAEVRAATAVNGRMLTPAQMGTLVSGLTPGQTVYFGAFGYSGLNGTGKESSAMETDEAIFTLVAPVLEPTYENEAGATATFGVTVRDPGGQASTLHVRTKSGTGAWSAPALVTSAPGNGVEYRENVTAVEGHPSHVEFTLNYTLAGQALADVKLSPPFDRGQIPNVTIAPTIAEPSGAGSATLKGDFDTASFKALGRTDRYPTDTEVRAAGAINGRVLDAATVGTLATVSTGGTLYVAAFGYSAAGGGGNESSALVKAQIGRGAPVTPKVQAQATRSGTTATVTVDVVDAHLRVTAIEYNTGSGWSGVWTIDTGVPGAATTLTRSINVTVTDGLHQDFQWRVIYTDSNGTSRTIGDSVPLANLRSLSKTLRIPFAEMVPQQSSTPWSLASGYLTRGSVGLAYYWGSTVLPKGVTITNVSCRLYRESASDTASFELKWQDDVAWITPIASGAHSSTNWQTVSAVANRLVGDETYTWFISLDCVTNTTSARMLWLEIAYTVPDYSKSY